MRSILIPLLITASIASYGSNYVISLQDTENSISFDKVDSILKILNPGDTLLFTKGEYHLNKSFTPVQSGAKDNPIVIRNLPDQRVIFNGINFREDPETGLPLSRSRTGLITIKDVKHIEVSGIEVRNSHNIGIVVKDKETEYISIRDCKSHGSYNSGIALWYSRNCLIEYCEITGANDQELRTVERLRREAPHEALTIAGAENFTVRYNHIHNCMKEGIDCKEVSANGVIHHNFIHDLPRQGLYLDSWFGILHDVEVHSNIVFACEWGLAISAEGKGSEMKDIRIHHNLLFENRASGLLFGVWGHDRPRRDIAIYNNTIAHNGSPGHWAGKTGGIDIRSRNLNDILIFNNIISKNWAFQIASFAEGSSVSDSLEVRNISIVNNLITNEEEIFEEERFFNQVYTFVPKKTIIADPKFKNTGLFRYGIKENSPANNKGKIINGLGTKKYLGSGEELYIWLGE